MAHLYESIQPKSQYSDSWFDGTREEYYAALNKSNTLYVGNLSHFTTEEQIFVVFSKCGPIKRIVMGLDRFKRTPCGFCFVEYEDRGSAKAAVNCISGMKVDSRVIRVDWDLGFVEGRQYGRGKGGGQVRDDYREEFDQGRGGRGALVDANATQIPMNVGGIPGLGAMNAAQVAQGMMRMQGQGGMGQDQRRWSGSGTGYRKRGRYDDDRGRRASERPVERAWERGVDRMSGGMQSRRDWSVPQGSRVAGSDSDGRDGSQNPKRARISENNPEWNIGNDTAPNTVPSEVETRNISDAGSGQNEWSIPQDGSDWVSTNQADNDNGEKNDNPRFRDQDGWG